MPGVDKECEGPGATHHFACNCREREFKNILIERDILRSKLTKAMNGLLWIERVNATDSQYRLVAKQVRIEIEEGK